MLLELVLDPSVSHAGDGIPLHLDGFLGSAFSVQDPWLLLPIIGVWLLLARDIPTAVEDFFASMQRCEQLTRHSLSPSQCRLLPATGLRSFPPHGRVPRPAVVERLLAEAAATTLPPTT